MKRLFYSIVKSGIFLSIPLLLFFIFFIKNQFVLRKIIVICSYKIPLPVSQLQTFNLLFLNSEQVKAKILLTAPMLRDITIQRTFPNILTLNCEMRVPVAILVLPDKNSYIDENGMVFDGIENSQNLVKIEIESVKPFTYTNEDWRLGKAARYISNLNNLQLNPEHFYIQEDKAIFKIILKKGTKVFIPQKNDPVVMVASLQTIVSRFRIEGKFVSKIDFQFDKPLVVLSDGRSVQTRQ